VKLLLVCLAAHLAACGYSAEFGDCAVRCADDTGCPEGLSCGSEGLCRTASQSESCAAILGTPLSCVALPPTCGPAGSEDCCASPTVPGGTFYRSYDVAADGMYPDMGYPATVSAFALDRYEVTVGRFRAFVEAGAGTQARPPATGAGAHASIPGSGWDPSWDGALVADAAALAAALACDATYQTWTDAPGPTESLPINCVTWYEAMAFCAWDGATLPTEAEWNYAAAGGDAQRAYPWSDPAGSTAVDCAHANSSACTSAPDRVGATSPEGVGRWGHADLAGNAFEWTLDGSGAYPDPCDDCSNLAATSDRVLRGGGWDNLASEVRGAYRLGRPSNLRHRAVGLRCARAPAG
jgi:formylglycine-generating enzyme